jgi:hypothetical protein
MTTREQLHHLLGALPDRDLPAVHDFIEALHRERRVGLPRALRDAPNDDEPDTKDEQAATDAAWQEYRRDERIPADQIRREIGG